MLLKDGTLTNISENLLKTKRISNIKNAELTKQRIMLAAKQEFSSYGFDGARVDEIAKRAQVNKQLIYYYFKNKDNLFVEILKESFSNLRKTEQLLDLVNCNAFESILKLVRANWLYYSKNPELIYFLASENLLHGRHLKQHNKEFSEINAPWLELTKSIIEKGKVDKTIRTDIDPAQLNISIAGLIIFSIMNQYTLSVSLGEDLTTNEAKSNRINSILDTISSWIKPKVN